MFGKLDIFEPLDRVKKWEEHLLFPLLIEGNLNFHKLLHEMVLRKLSAAEVLVSDMIVNFASLYELSLEY